MFGLLKDPEVANSIGRDGLTSTERGMLKEVDLEEVIGKVSVHCRVFTVQLCIAVFALCGLC